jgi:hypothetical protein
VRRRTEPDPRRELDELDKVGIPGAKAKIGAANDELRDLLVRRQELERAVVRLDAIDMAAADLERDAVKNEELARVKELHADACLAEADALVADQRTLERLEAEEEKAAGMHAEAEQAYQAAVMNGLPDTQIRALRDEARGLAERADQVGAQREQLIAARVEKERLVAEAEAARSEAREFSAEAERLRRGINDLPELITKRAVAEWEQRERLKSQRPMSKPKEVPPMLLVKDGYGLTHDIVSGRVFAADGTPLSLNH